jgi:alpha-galactosidase
MNNRRDFIKAVVSVPLASAFLDGSEAAPGAQDVVGANAPTVKADDMVKPEDLEVKNQWVGKHLLAANPMLPFSFVYGRETSEALRPTWSKETHQKKLDDARIERTFTWLDPKTGLEVRLVALDYMDYPVIEWTVYFKNHGRNDTPIIEDVEALDTTVPVTDNSLPTLLYSKGCGGMDTYALQKKALNQLDYLRLSNPGGGKTGESIPFFNILMQQRGLIGAVGWPGKWFISITHTTDAAIVAEAGMEGTHLSLHPGEEIRTPQILLLPWQGNCIDAHNLLRRQILKYHTPQYDGKPVVPPLSQGGWGGMKTTTCLRLIEQAADEKIGYENFWMDAGWYGADRQVDEFQVFGHEDWFLHAGNWKVNKVPHPNGLKPISDAAHAKGMKFLLWFEPERAVVGTPLTLEHPEWFIGEVGVNFGGDVNRPFVKYRLFDMGNPTARRYMIDWISEFITQQGIDIYRQDCNFDLSYFWSRADAGDRQGITEIRYVEGLLQFWDELRRKHPLLILDVCQRCDLETMSRALDLTRADYPVSPGADPIAGQMSTQGLVYWRPHFGTCLQTRPRDTYYFRSAASPGLVFSTFNGAGTREQVGKFTPPDYPFDWLRTMVEQLKRVRPYYYGDYYPLSPCSTRGDCTMEGSKERSAAWEWAAWQFNRPEEGDGILQAFRRDKCEEATKTYRLRHLDPSAHYEITNFDVEGSLTRSGKELMEAGLAMEIKDQPGAALIAYKRVG